jgi:GxxExxY protein
VHAIDGDPQTYSIIGAAMDVHNALGCGFLEPVYFEPFEIELMARRIPFQRHVQLPILYKNRLLRKTYCADYICYGEVIVELKALASIGSLEEAQLINYLRAARLERGLLINFGARSLQYKRRVWQYNHAPRGAAAGQSHETNRSDESER